MESSVQERFWSKVRKTPFCWLWIGSIRNRDSRRQRGYLKVGGRKILAHRLSWEIHYGEIPTGLDVLHTCDNGLCVNSQHLFIGTHQDNMEDMKNKGRAARLTGEDNPASKLTEGDVTIIRERYRKEKISHRQLAKEFRVSKTLVGKILNFDSWIHL